jgi:hypothetical protein
MEYAIALIAVVGVVYFVAYKLTQKKAKPEYTGVGGRPRPGVQTEEK